MHLNELKALHVSEVLKQAEELEIENTGRMRKQELMFAIIKKRARTGEQIIADGVLEILPDGFGFLRSPDTSYTASTDYNWWGAPLCLNIARLPHSIALRTSSSLHCLPP